MFDRLRSLFGGAEKPRQASPQLAMPLFSSPDPIEPDALVERWATLFPEAPPLRVEGRKETVVQYVTARRPIMVIHVPAPVPKDEATHAIRSSWMWQKPDDPVRDHRAHAIVTALAASDPVQDALSVTRFSAAMLSAGKGVALYWGNSRQVHDAGLVVDFAKAGDTLPVPLWVGITISAQSAKGPFSAATHGLEALGHKEFEVLETTKGIGDLRSTLLDLALYVLGSGPVLLDGQTFGPSADVKWTIRHVKSELVPGRQVIVLGIP